jgi:hypothetical protein
MRNDGVFMEITPQIKAYFEAKKGNFDVNAHYFADDICIEDTGENNIIQGYADCKKWLKEKSQQYEMETKIIEIKAEEDGNIKVSTLVNVHSSPDHFPFDYFFTVENEKIKSVKIVYTGN